MKAGQDKRKGALGPGGCIAVHEDKLESRFLATFNLSAMGPAGEDGALHRGAAYALDTRLRETTEVDGVGVGGIMDPCTNQSGELVG